MRKAALAADAAPPSAFQTSRLGGGQVGGSQARELEAAPDPHTAAAASQPVAGGAGAPAAPAHGGEDPGHSGGSQGVDERMPLQFGARVVASRGRGRRGRSGARGSR